MAYMQQGFGEYDAVRPWTWMYNPPPYAFLNGRGVKPPPLFIAPARSMGMGCAGDCHCGGACGGHGVGDVAGGIDFSLGSPGIVNAIGSKLGVALPAVPNWIVYGAGIAAVAMARGGR